MAFAALPAGALRASELDLPQADRLPWTRGAQAFQRSYLALGPLPAEAAAGVALEAIVAARPWPGAEQAALPPGNALRWQPAASWTDTIDLAGLVAALPAGEASVAFVRFSLKRERAGPAEIAIGCDAPISVWANGTALGEADAPAGFQPDQRRFPAQLQAGANDVLLRLHLDVRPCRLSLRALEPGQVAASDGALWPSIDWEAHPALRVRLGDAPDPDATPARFEVIAPGGRVVASAEAPRGQELAFDVGSWPEGPYEIRCSSRSAWGEPVVAYLPWFKGDAVEAARRATEASAPSEASATGLVRPMLVEMLRDRLAPASPQSPSLAVAALHAPLFELAELALEDSGSSARARPGGMLRLAWIDEVDGSAQFCRAYLPANYDPSRSWPTIVSLHGFNPPNPPYRQWWGIDARHHEQAERRDVVVLEPHGRGNTQYMGIGEQDVLRALAEARGRISIDDARVYITGESMGGAGSWLLASRHADTFAAVAPVFGGWEFRVAPPDGSPAAQASTPRQAFALERRSSFVGIESLIATPVYALHGDSDFVASVENTRHAARLLQRWGYEIRYRELPGLGHEDLGAKDEIARWLLQYRLAEAPQRARLRSPDLLGAKSHWLQVEGFEEPERLIAADAAVIEPGILRLDTHNVAAAAISLPPSLRGDSDRLRAIWNGETREVAIVDGIARIATEAWRNEARPKKPGLEGPVSDIIRTPFLVVVGTTSADAAMRRRCREKAEAFRELWQSWQGSEPRVMDDVDVGPEEERAYSLLLLGGPDANAVSKRMESDLPLAADASGVSIQGRRWDARDAVAESIWPSPYHTDRYVLLVAATSADGMYFWDPLLWVIPFGAPSRLWDWRIVDGRLVDLADALSPERAWIAAGNFDGAWRSDARWIATGDEALRANSRLRKAPPPGGIALDAAALDSLCGRYEISPFVGAVVSRSGESIQISIAGSSPIALSAESADVFATAGANAPIAFARDEDGIAQSLTLYGGGQATVAKRAR